MEVSATTVSGLVAALGIGLLIGVERERRKGHGSLRSAAGVRTHALLSLSGALASSSTPDSSSLPLSPWGPSRWSATRAPTVRIRVSPARSRCWSALLLGAVAVENAALASGVGVVVAVLLHTKRPLHRFSRDYLTQTELGDLLLPAAAILVIWPLLPDRALDPWGVLNPASLWKFVVLVMAVGAAGHVALRVVGARWGLPLAGFFSGFASRRPPWRASAAGPGHPEIRSPAAAAALLANLASHLLFVVVGAGSAALLRSVGWAWPRTAWCCWRRASGSGVPDETEPPPGQPTAGLSA